MNQRLLAAWNTLSYLKLQGNGASRKYIRWVMVRNYLDYLKRGKGNKAWKRAQAASDEEAKSTVFAAGNFIVTA